ncbi:ribonuclease III [Myxococcus sp. K15C18031901]|uniref:ribonuclease III n=1 Tax=Myxococcus dinghuensis TaxID=2906761 RepID=UPI0020A6E752|nr:ribonuclease III [Myxococcus dinghuensis]MCP3099344.1 ribonuclease III [Myxococcus dinghuensis]
MEKLSQSERVAALETRLGLVFSRREVALEALTHKTYVNENKDKDLKDNQRLEFLGDSVVNLVVGHRLMERFPSVPEGDLTKMRARVVNEDGLARVARGLPLGDLLLLGRGELLSGGREKPSVLADALEAVFGAVYLCAGLEAAGALVDRLFAELLDEVSTGQGRLDYKTLLQEMAHEKRKVSPRYRVISETGPEHAKVFEVEVTLADVSFARASGRSKKEAEQSAAQATLERLKQEAADEAANATQLQASPGAESPGEGAHPPPDAPTGDTPA